MVFDAIWSYNEKLQRFEYDCKYYVKTKYLVNRYTNKFIRVLNEKELKLINKYRSMLEE